MFHSHFFLQKMYFNWDSPSRKQNCQVISSEFEIDREKTDRKKTNVLMEKKQNEANPRVVCRFSTFPDLIILSTCSPMSANVS